MEIDEARIASEIRAALTELFEVPEADITPEARLDEDLGLDSIDAIDLIVRLQNFTGRKFKPDDFKSIRTVGDMTRVVKELLEDAR